MSEIAKIYSYALIALILLFIGFMIGDHLLAIQRNEQEKIDIERRNLELRGWEFRLNSTKVIWAYCDGGHGDFDVDRLQALRCYK